jgi:hypothetical protein
MRSSTIGTIRILVTALCCVCSTSLIAQNEPVQWQVDDTIVDADRTAILTLARRIGIERPRKVSLLYPFLENCPVVLVESMVVEDRRRLSWEQVAVHAQGRSRGGHVCERPAGKAVVQRLGRWAASGTDVSRREQWRVRDGGWHVDVYIADGISYAHTESIVLAIRRATLINRLPTSIGSLRLSTVMPEIDAASISTITRAGTAAQEYEVRTGVKAGLWLRVRVVDDAVELRNFGSWMVRIDALPNQPLQPANGADAASCSKQT